MATNDELIQLREELKKIQEQTKKSRGRAGIGIGLLLGVLTISIIYAFVQDVKSVRNAEEALRQQMLAEEVRKTAAKSSEEASAARDFAAHLAKQLEECRMNRK